MFQLDVIQNTNHIITRIKICVNVNLCESSFSKDSDTLESSSVCLRNRELINTGDELMAKISIGRNT